MEDTAIATGLPGALRRERARARRRRIGRRRLLRVFSRSALVGIVATLADVLALFALVQWGGLSPRAANVPALLFGVAIQYLGNKYLAFEDYSKDHVRQGTLFAVVEAGTLLLNAVGFDLLVAHTPIPYWLVRPLVTFAVYMGFSLPLWARIFRRTDRAGEAVRRS